jgi:phosphoribosylanthranilate isomerase
VKQARIKIKVCGITRARDAQLAASLGADAVGFIFAESPRRADVKTCREIISLLPPFVDAVGVFVNEDAKKVKEIAAFCRLDWVQLHGNEPPEYCRRLGLKALKVIRVKGSRSIEQMHAYQGVAGGFLLDTYVAGIAGGTGKTFNWDLAVQAKEYGPVILSGGLTPENIRLATETVMPYGVDVSSGVEASPGIKDENRLRELFLNIRIPL